MPERTAQIPSPYNEPIYDYKASDTHTKQVKEQLSSLSKQPLNVPMVINGKKIFHSEATKEVSAPHQHDLKIAKLTNATSEDIQQAISSCVTAQKKWTLMPLQQRSAIFLKAADLLTSKYRARINAATMLGQSKTIIQAEIDAVCELADFLRFNASFAEQIASMQPYSPNTLWNASEPRGLEGFVYAIGPFNFTSISVNLATSPVLMGCSVLWKPSETAMYSSYLCYEILEEAGLPPGVINLVSGDSKTISDVALYHPDLAGIHFTGSTRTFNYLWSEVGKNINNYKTYPRLVGETGGKDFIFAHPSADVDALKIACIRGAYEYQGQKCSAASRAYVPASIWKKLKAPLVEEIQKIKMGDPADFSNFVSAVIDKKSYSNITGYIDHAKQDKDSQIIAGGEYDDKVGYYVKPTLIETSNPKSKTMVEEIFGPVLTVYAYEDSQVNQTVELVDNSTPYALTGAIFAQDREAINDLTTKLNYAAGNFYINDKPTGAVVGQQPFGGSRASGTNDKAGSILNLLRWVSMRTIKENFVPPKEDYKYPHMD